MLSLLSWFTSPHNRPLQDLKSVSEFPAMELVHVGRRGEALSHKNRCLFRVMMCESSRFLCASLGSRRWRDGEGRRMREKREKAEGRRELKGSSEVRKSKGERKSEGIQSFSAASFWASPVAQTQSRSHWCPYSKFTTTWTPVPSLS